MFNVIDEKLDEHAKIHAKILEQVTFTNGKVRKLYAYLLVVASVTVTLLVTSGSEVLEVFKIII